MEGQHGEEGEQAAPGCQEAGRHRGEGDRRGREEGGRGSSGHRQGGRQDEGRQDRQEAGEGGRQGRQERRRRGRNAGQDRREEDPGEREAAGEVQRGQDRSLPREESSYRGQEGRRN